MRDSSNPSLVCAIARKRALATSPKGDSYNNTHADAAVPRPTRPRSWCSWLKPNRSACSITIKEALGTSTPTSITVVLTKTRKVPATNAAITACFSEGDKRPCIKPTGVSSPSDSLNSACACVAWRKSSASLSSISGHTQYTCRPAKTCSRMRVTNSSRRAADNTRVTMGVRPGGNESMVDTSKSA